MNDGKLSLPGSLHVDFCLLPGTDAEQGVFFSSLPVLRPHGKPGQNCRKCRIQYRKAGKIPVYPRSGILDIGLLARPDLKKSAGNAGKHTRSGIYPLQTLLHTPPVLRLKVSCPGDPAALLRMEPSARQNLTLFFSCPVLTSASFRQLQINPHQAITKRNHPCPPAVCDRKISSRLIYKKRFPFFCFPDFPGRIFRIPESDFTAVTFDRLLKDGLLCLFPVHPERKNADLMQLYLSLSACAQSHFRPRKTQNL